MWRTVDESRRDFYLDYAQKHYNTALHISAHLHPVVNDDNRLARYLLGTLLHAYTFARGPIRNDYLLFTHQSSADCKPPHWVSLLEGMMKPLNLQLAEINFFSPPPAAFHHLQRAPAVTAVPPTVVAATATTGTRSRSLHPRADLDNLNHLRQIIRVTASNPHHILILANTLDELSVLFAHRTLPAAGPNGPNGHPNNIVSLANLGFFLSRAALAGFGPLCQQRHPATLAIFAHFLIVAHDHRASWILDGWVRHLLGGVCAAMPVEFHPWIQWPVAQIGGDACVRGAVAVGG
jgi:hypothetical protein